MGKNEFITYVMNEFPGCRRNVIEFIANVRYHNTIEGSAPIVNLFGAGYCYYFALMLQSAFQCGTVCYVIGHGHIVWIDGIRLNEDIAYDINGVYKDYGKDDLIPVREFERGVWDFKHVPGVQSNITTEEMNEIITSWKNSTDGIAHASGIINMI